MSVITRVVDKAGVIGVIVGSFSCALCFPAAASLGAVIGLGFLSQWEGLFVHWLIPIFAAVALLANLAGWFSHHQWRRRLLGSVGPGLALVGGAVVSASAPMISVGTRTLVQLLTVGHGWSGVAADYFAGARRARSSVGRSRTPRARPRGGRPPHPTAPRSRGAAGFPPPPPAAPSTSSR